MPEIPSIDDVRAAAERIAPYVHRTPVMTSASANRELGLRAWFKCENLQKVGAFKARGAVNAVLSLEPDEAARGVVTHSSGNHGQALAYAASLLGIPCTVVVPDDAPPVKLAAIEAYGARLVRGPRSQRERLTEREVEETGAVLVHPYEDPRVVAGQGTAALELFEDLPELDAVIVPVGGGGLISGTSIVRRALAPEALLIGAEPEGADDAFRSLEEGRRRAGSTEHRTIADGLLSVIGELAFAVLVRDGVEIQLVSDPEIAAAARFHLERMKLLVEPSGAVGLAALRRRAARLGGRDVGVIVSGGNTDLGWFPGEGSA